MSENSDDASRLARIQRMARKEATLRARGQADSRGAMLRDTAAEQRTTASSYSQVSGLSSPSSPVSPVSPGSGRAPPMIAALMQEGGEHPSFKRGVSGPSSPVSP